MLIGEFEHSVDFKGRVAVPSKFREDLQSNFFVTKGVDGCLFALSGTEWQNLELKIRDLPLSKARTLQRFFFSGAAQVETDKQGRILIPANLRDYANLEKNVTFVGVSNRVEIWDSAKWKKVNSLLTEEDVTQVMDLLGF